MAHSVLLADLAVIGFGIVGLAFAGFGAFEPWLVLPLGALATLALARTTTLAVEPIGPKPQGRSSGDDRSNRRDRTRRIDQIAAIAIVGFVALMSAYSVRHGAQHIEINRDPGVHVNAARWLDRDGSLEVPVASGPFADAPGLSYETQGLPQPRIGTLQFQGNHLLPALMAEAGWLGGDDAMFAMPILLGALALLTVYVFTASRTSSLPALAASLALGSSVLWIAFARDAYTEIPSLLLIAFALVRLPVGGGTPRPGAALQIGAALGATCALRIDAPLILMLWPVIIATWWSGDGRSRGAGRATRALLAGLALTGSVAALDLFVRSPMYARDLAGFALALWAALAAAAGIVWASVAWPRARRITERAAATYESRRPFRIGAAIGFAGIALALWFVRPQVETVYGRGQRSVALLQELLQLPIEPTRKYSEYSFEWQAWYLGPILVALAIIGIALAIAYRPIGRRLAPLLLTAAPASVLYLWRPFIFPDHTWVMRRFLSTLTFALVVGAAMTLHALMRTHSLTRAARLAIGVSLATAMVALPAWSSRTVRAGADQHGFVDAVRDACAVLGPDAAVVVMARDHALSKRLPQALRGWCGAQVAIGDPLVLTENVRRDLAAAWAARGVDLYLVATRPSRVANLCPAAPGQRVVAENRFLIEQTLTRRPRGYTTQSLDFTIFAARDCDRPG